MKKIILLLLILCIALSASACRSEPSILPVLPEASQSTKTPEPKQIPERTLAPEPVFEPETFDIEAMLARPVQDHEKGMLYGYGNDGYAELRYEVRYAFEQLALPMTALSLEDDVIYCLENGDLDALDELIYIVWEHALMVIAGEDFERLSHSFGITEFNEEHVLEYIERMRELCILDSEDNIIGVTVENLGGNTTAAFITMYATGWSHLCEYIAIVTDGAGALAYYTLERSYDEGDDTKYYFCFVDLYGRGTFYEIENTLEAFTEAIMTEGNIAAAEQTR